MKSPKIDPLQIEVEPYDVDPGRIAGTSPIIGMVTLWSSTDGLHSHGVWEMTPGVLDHVQGGETVVILSGRATIEFINDGTFLDVEPGDMCVINPDDLTRWTVHETLRKTFARQTAAAL